jgi:hypothetical protein
LFTLAASSRSHPAAIDPVSRASPASQASATDPLPLWWLPLVAGLLPLLGTAVAFQLSVYLALIPSCNPFFDGCVSISRAARHDLPNHIFRALLLPAAALQALTWLLVARWLADRDAPARLLQFLPMIGLLAAVFLVLYGSFLGTEGVAYRWMRRYGVIFYFGCTCIAMLIAAGAAVRRAQSEAALAMPAKLLRALVLALPALGLVSAGAPLIWQSEAARDAIENVLEWWAGLCFTLYFFALAWTWWRLQVRGLLLR